MKLWTVKSLRFLSYLEENKTIICNKSIADYRDEGQDYVKAFVWMRERMAEKVGQSSKAYFPIWAWYEYEGKKQCPSVEELKLKENQCIIELDIPEDRLVLSDYEAWETVLKDGYIFDLPSEEEVLVEEKRLKKLPLKMQEEIKKESWESIFETGQVNPLYSSGKFIQASFWNIDCDDISNIYYVK